MLNFGEKIQISNFKSFCRGSQTLSRRSRLVLSETSQSTLVSFMLEFFQLLHSFRSCDRKCVKKQDFRRGVRKNLVFSDGMKQFRKFFHHSTGIKCLSNFAAGRLLESKIYSRLPTFEVGFSRKNADFEI